MLCLEILMQYSFFISAPGLVFPGSDTPQLGHPSNLFSFLKQKDEFLRFGGHCALSVYICCALHFRGHVVPQSVEALRYELEGHRFDSQWCHRNFLLT